MAESTTDSAGGQKIWVKTAEANLYERRTANTPKTARGTFYSRYELNGEQKSVSLRTKVWSHAKIKHREHMLSVEKVRGRARNSDGTFQTLGELWNEMAERYSKTVVAKNTEIGRANSMARLKQHWQRGDFEKFRVNLVTHEIIDELRTYLLNTAPWRYHFGKKRRGYSLPVVEQTMRVLEIMLDIAVEKRVIFENCFSEKVILRSSSRSAKAGTLKSGARPKEIALPSRPDMMRIVEEMRRVPPPKNGYDGNPGKVAHLQKMAEELADHTELLIYSGMRKGEAKKSTVGDDLGESFRIWGTKNDGADRTIPVNPSLRNVLDRLKARRSGVTDRLVVTAEPGKALKRACVRLGLPKMRNHDLRHFFASACIASGVDVITTARWMGHADTTQILKTYGHLLKDRSYAAAQLVNFRG